MNRLVKTAALAALGVAMGTTAKAQYNANDLILGFTKTGAANDYVIDLGNANTTVGVGGSTVHDLSGDFSLATLSAQFGGLNGASMGVAGGNGATAGRDLYYTELRGALGTPPVPGSTAPGSLASTPIANGANDVSAVANGLPLSAGQSATPAQGNASSWSTAVVNFGIDTGRNPMSQANGSLIYEDLYRGTPNGAFAYDGFFTLDTSGSGSLTFTPAATAVPEPSTYGMLAGAGLLALSLRRQFTHKSA